MDEDKVSTFAPVKDSRNIGSSDKMHGEFTEDTDTTLSATMPSHIHLASPMTEDSCTIDTLNATPESSESLNDGIQNSSSQNIVSCGTEKNHEPNNNRLQQSTALPLVPHKLLKDIRRSKAVLPEKSSAQNELVIQLNAICDQYLIQAYLSELFGNRFAFTISHVVHKKKGTECIAHFTSKIVAERIKMQLNQMTMQTGCCARFYDDVAIDETKIKSHLQKEWAALWKDAQISLSSHQDKIDTTARKLKDKKAQPFAVGEIDTALSEIDALDKKLKEYRCQMEEFKDFLGLLDAEFKMIDSTSNVGYILSTMKSSFVIEKERIENCLPMYAFKSRIVETIANNQVSIILGETGSGKSTQVAQYLYEAGICDHGLLVCTQPRKVAAISLTKRVAQEMHTKVGKLVGFKVGMQTHISGDTKLLYMTDHVLLKECLEDPMMTKYSCIVIDEAHERSINTDLLLGMIKKCLSKRPDLRVIITSATINPGVFISFFEGCPVLEVSGRVFPVEVVYSSSRLSSAGDHLNRAIQKAIEISKNEKHGDVLVFLTTPIETEKACDRLKTILRGHQVIPLALHGKTQSADLQKVFDPPPSGTRKIVFATNSAETSITIPGIKYVIDSGLVKEMQYDPSKSMSALQITAVSRSSADQRKGRAGRTSVGKCYRLYSEDDYLEMRESTLPEILRVHLGMAILDLMALQVDIFEFDFVQAPPKVAIEKASEVLEFIGATKEQHLTELGRKLSKLSLEPRLGKLVIRGIEDGIPYESVLVASFSSMGGSMFFRGGSDEEKDMADKLKVQFCDFSGDFHTMLNVFKEWDKVPEKYKNKWCVDNSINAKSMRMARDTASEVINTLKRNLNIPVKQEYKDRHFVGGRLESLMIEMFAQNVCLFSGHEKLGYYVVLDHRILHIHPSSALKSLAKLPEVLVFENTLTTSRDFMLNVTCISDETSPNLQQHGIQNSIEICRKNMVYPFVIEHIGECTMKSIVGKNFSGLKRLETELQKALKTSQVIIDANFDYGTITIFSGKDNHDKAASFISDVIEKERVRMSMEDMERQLIDASPIRAVIGNGGGIKDLLFANEFRSLIVHDVPSAETTDSLAELFTEFGRVIDLQANSKKGTNKCWVKVAFENKGDAMEAMSAIEKGDLEIEWKVKPDFIGTFGIRSQRQAEIQLKLTWCRRPLKGIGFVKFQKEDSKQAQRVIERVRTINIEGTTVRLQLSKKNESELFLTSIPKDSLHEMIITRIKEAIENASGTQPVEVVLPRENVAQTSKSDMQQFKKVIETTVINQDIDIDDLHLHMPMPKDKSFEYLAFLNVPNNAMIRNIENALKNMKIMGNRVHVKMIMKSSIMVPNEILPYIQEEINSVIDMLKEKFHQSIDIRGKQLQSGLFVVNLQSESVKDMVFIRAKISEVIEGKAVSLGERKVLSYFYMNTGQKFLNKVMKRNNIYIQINNFRQSLHLYGRLKDIQKSEKAIEHQIRYLLDLCNKSFKLAEEFPPGMSKLLILRYGIHLNKFCNDTFVEYVDLKLRTHTLIVQGDSKSIANAEKLLKILSNQLLEKGPMKKEIDLPNCAGCFCSIEIGDIYRLEGCGHAYDKECVKHMFKHAIKDKDFPITCMFEGCGKNITVRDIFAIVGNRMKDLTPLLEGAIDKYVSMRKDTVMYCITPNCPMVYKATAEMNIDVCSMCCMKICTHCHCQFHEGLTCEVYQSNPEDAENLSEWLAEDTQNHALCPKCGSRIEKNGGCMHMQCTMCNIFICWKCKASFQTSKETYDHLSTACGGIFQ